MRMPLVLSLFAASLLSLAVGAVAIRAADKFELPPNTEKATTSPMAPDEVVRTARLPEGFQLSVFAGEPDVQNPIAMTTDERGRLWIAENYSWAGGGAGGFDGSLRDRIVVLEDTDGDGKHDRRTVFWDDARKLTSLEVGHGGVWAICLPNLLFFPDRDRDDRPDGPPEVILDGFDEGPVGHTPANGLKWGPDGRLYGRHGILATSLVGKPGASASQRFPINTGIWRYDVETDSAEAVMHGMTNPWGMDYSAEGEIFSINTVIGHLWHVIPGLHTERMFGVDLNPHTYRLVGQVADHVHWDVGELWSDVRQGVTDKTSAVGGGHAHIGLMIYQGDNWPDVYRNKVMTLNLHGRRINVETLKRQEAGYVATHEPDICFIEDPWYRAMELLTGPDGGVFIADWSDTGECHDHDGVHRSSGRIYKLTYGTPKAVSKLDLTTKSNEDLAKLLSHKNAWWARQARRLLQERARAGDRDNIAKLLEGGLASVADPIQRVSWLQGLGAVSPDNTNFWLSRLQSPEEVERAWAVRVLLDRPSLEPRRLEEPLRGALMKLAETDDAGLVRLHLASSLGRLADADRWDLGVRLASRDLHANDRLFPLLVWYGLEPTLPRASSRALELLERSRQPLLTEAVSWRLGLELESHPETVEALLKLVETGRVANPDRVLVGLAAALNGWQRAKPPANWDSIKQKYAANKEAAGDAVRSLQLVFGDGRAIGELKAMVVDGKVAPEARLKALQSLMKTPPEDYAPVLMNLLGDRALYREAIRGLAHYSDPKIPGALLGRIDSFDALAREDMIAALSTRPEFARALLQGARDGKLAARDISAFHARQIASLGDDALLRELVEVWGEVRTSPREKKELIERHRAALTPDVIAKADSSAGRAVFQRVCANCHVLYGAGRRVGPDITGGNRQNLDYLLENIVDPSASVGTAFKTLVVVMNSGQVVNGVTVAETERTLALLTAKESVTIDRREIDEIATTSVSLMPDGLLQNLSPDEIRDLIAYLSGTSQVPLPVEKTSE
jgi:putative membrane-bound dehydrogenase-like protein